MFQRIQSYLYAKLKLAEKVLKVDMVYFAKGGSWLATGQVISVVSAFLLSLALANFLPKDVYGTYRWALSIASIFSIFSLSGMGDTVIRSVAQGFDRTLIPATKARIKGGSIGSVIALGIAGYYYFSGNATLAVILLIIAVFLPFFDVFSNYGSYLQGKKDFRRNIIYGVVVQVLSVIVLIATSYFTRSLIPILLAYFGSYTLFRYIAYRLTVSSIAHDARSDPNAVRYGGHLSAISVLGTFAGQLDSVLLFHFLGPVEVAVYAIAIAAPNQLKQLHALVARLIFPKYAAHPEEAIRENIWTKVAFFGITAVAGIAIYIVLAPWFFSTFYPAYHEAVFFSQLFALSMINAVSTPAEIFLEARGMVKEQYVSNIATSIFQIASMVTGIVYFGLLGLILARIATRFFGSAINMFLYYRPFKKAAPS